jgi:hypothetical protein
VKGFKDREALLCVNDCIVLEINRVKKVQMVLFPDDYKTV